MTEQTQEKRELRTPFQKLAKILDGFDTAKLNGNDQTEIYRFWEKNASFFQTLAWRWYRNAMNYRPRKGLMKFSVKGVDVEDLIQTAYLNIPLYCFRSYERLCKSVYKAFRYAVPRGEGGQISLYRPIGQDENGDNIGTLADFIPASEVKNSPCSDIPTLKRLIDWLKTNLTSLEYQYIYHRYIEYGTTVEVWQAIGYSSAHGDGEIKRMDYRICQKIRERYVDLVQNVGGEFNKYTGLIPPAIETRRDCMTSFRYT